MTDSELDVFYKNYFVVNRLDTLLCNVANSFVHHNFISNAITNSHYESIVFKNIQNLLITELKKNIQEEELFYKETSTYIFKKELKNIFNSLADLLLVQLVQGNSNVRNFLEYYALDTIIVNSVKFKVPSIEKEVGINWNTTSIISILKTYVKAEAILAKSRINLEKINEKSYLYYIDSLSPLEHNKIIDTQHELVENSILEHENRIQVLRDSLYILHNKKDLDATTVELNKYLTYREELRYKKRNLISQKVKHKDVMEYLSLQKEVESIKRSTQHETLLIEKNKNSYQSIKDSLIKALMSKKKAL